MITVSNVFIPVTDPVQAAAWYSDHLALTIVSATAWSAVLRGEGGASVTLMGPASGIRVRPGLAWATCGFLVDDLDAARDRHLAAGLDVSPVDGAAEVCLYFTIRDSDGNVLLLTDR